MRGYFFPLILALCLLGLVARAQTHESIFPDVIGFPVQPPTTDPAIKDLGEPHWIYVDRKIIVDHDPQSTPDRGELLLWLPGTRPPSTPAATPGHVHRLASYVLCEMAASLGYHVIELSYPNALSASSCNDDTDPKAFENFRMTIIAGGQSPHITVSAADSIENRLIKLLQKLAVDYPQENWSQFLNTDGTIKWQQIAVAGQSQGGGHAALIGIHHHVARVLCFSAPKDYSTALNAPASWYAEPSETPKDHFYTFNHQQDRQGCTPEQLLENLHALQLDQLGAAVLVDQVPAPFQNSHILLTNYPGTPISSGVAHGTVIDPKNESRFADVWRYMLTH